MRLNNILPAHPHPMTGELFSSWFSRLASANASKVHSFAVEIFGKDYGNSFWSRDIDCFIDSFQIDQISHRTGLSTEIIFQTTMKSYEGTLLHKLSTGFNKWILPCGIHHRTRKNNWIVYCPLCLAADVEPYYRKDWRLSLSTICPIHHVYMLDQCPICKNPINFFRQELGNRAKYAIGSIRDCAYCGFDLCAADIKLVEIENNDIFADLLSLIKQANQGWWYLKQSNQVLPISLSYYDVVHYLCSFLNSSVGVVLYNEAIINLNLDDAILGEYKRNRVFETRNLKERTCLLLCTLWLLENWPTRIIELSQKHGITASRITRSEALPYWFACEIDKYLRGNDAIARNYL